MRGDVRRAMPPAAIMPSDAGSTERRDAGDVLTRRHGTKQTPAA